MPSQRHVILQLPFPATSNPHPSLERYYRDYSRRFAKVVPGFDLPEGALWELPLWVAHLSGMLEGLGITPQLLDLSMAPPTVQTCATVVLDHTSPGDSVYLSPLAQNFDLAVAVSRALLQGGRRTLLGGNMATLAAPEDAAVIHRGRLSPQALRELVEHGSATPLENSPGRISWSPSYRLLAGYRGRVPMLRLNASHGCLFRCSYCGDSWSRQLYVTEREALEREVEELETCFPDTHLIYVGDKTFGQSPEAVRNLFHVFESRRGFRFIVQTHELMVNDDLIEAMARLGVVGVELGFETADASLLRASNKATHGRGSFLGKVRMLRRAGFHVILNVLGGLPAETRESHALTVEFLKRAAEDAWLFNLYNFVPYPLTPYFPLLRERIFDWRYASWREDAPPVYRPFELSPKESWRLFLEKVEVAHSIVRVGGGEAECPAAACG